MKIVTADVDSPLGTIRFAATDLGICALDYIDRWHVVQDYLEKRFGRISFQSASDPLGVGARLNRYLNGELKALEEIPVDPGGTPFQQRVWKALRAIPAGRTMSYGELARELGNPSGSRAVGTANGKNPVAIVIPCHRVIGADGGLCGYAGGIERKRWLLSHEGVILDQRLFAF